MRVLRVSQARCYCFSNGARTQGAGPRPDARITPMSDVRVVVADDDVLLREGLASLLDRSEFEVVGQAGHPDAAVA